VFSIILRKVPLCSRFCTHDQKFVDHIDIIVFGFGFLFNSFFLLGIELVESRGFHLEGLLLRWGRRSSGHRHFLGRKVLDGSFPVVCIIKYVVTHDELTSRVDRVVGLVTISTFFSSSEVDLIELDFSNLLVDRLQRRYQWTQ
jgi:hypothetical protein